MSEKRSAPRTHYIHRISYSAQERIVGTFVLLALFILLGLLLSSGKSKNMFEDSITLYGELQSIQSVNKDTEVVISGLPAGTVTSVDITSDNKVILTMKVLKKYHNLLRRDSVAKLSSFNLAVVQKSIIEITPGSTDAELLEDGSRLLIGEAFNIKNMIERVEPLFISLEDSIQKINNVLSAIDHGTLTATLDNVQRITADIRDITEHIRAAEGPVGNLIYGKEMATDIKALTANLVIASEDLKTMMQQLNKQAADIPELTNKIGPLLQEADKTIKASQRIWPLSSAMEEASQAGTLTSPAPAND